MGNDQNVQLRARWYEHGEKNRKYFYRRKHVLKTQVKFAF